MLKKKKLFCICSLKDYVADAGEFATRMVDSLLNILTGNQHAKANRIFEEVSYVFLVFIKN